MYCVQATRDGQQVPTFYLSENVQGIVSVEQAKVIAREIVGTGNVHIHVEYVGNN